MLVPRGGEQFVSVEKCGTEKKWQYRESDAQGRSRVVIPELQPPFSPLMLPVGSLCWEAAAPAWGLWGGFQPKGMAIVLIILILNTEFKNSFTLTF